MVVTKKLEGRDHLVVPVAMLRVGVFHGSHGPLIYPADVLRRTAPAWNGRPVIVEHVAMMDGGMADHPEVFSRQKVGVLFNSRFDGALRADAWLDVERLKSLSPGTLARIRQGKSVEVSTGLVSTLDETAGVHNGRPYIATVTNVVPDHLAILEIQQGACAIKDGCGMLVNAAADSEVPILEVPVMNFSSD